MFQKKSYSQTYGVVGAIIEKEGKILMVQENAPGQPAHEQWNQPAGWIDVGENPIDACIREVKEETGLDFKPTGLIGIYSLVKENLVPVLGPLPHPLKFIFRGEIVGGEIMQPNEEIMQLKWFTPEEIYEMPHPPLRDIDIKQEVKDYLAGHSIPLDRIVHTIQN